MCRQINQSRTWVDVVELHIAAPQSAFAREAFRYRVKGDEFSARADGLGHLVQHGAGGHEGRRGVDVLLVDLVRTKHEFVAVAEGDDVAQIALREALPRGVARVDVGHGLDGDALGARLVHGTLQSSDVERPIVFFLQIVRNQSASVKRYARRVEGVLGNGYEHAVRFTE